MTYFTENRASSIYGKMATAVFQGTPTSIPPAAG